MKRFRADRIEELSLRVGDRVELESLRQAVVPPFLMLAPFIETPAGVVTERETTLDDDGVHGCIYRLLVEAPGRGELAVGFRDLQSGATTHRKVIRVVARRASAAGTGGGSATDDPPRR